MFKKTFIMMILSAVFLGGYYVGNKEGSPDIFAQMRAKYAQAEKASKVLLDFVESKGCGANQARR
ncbi:MAG: hypothetical protein J7M14_06595 [Planctomycetes bacterium]|nr:hypothetical protein [Planctomycetota bacterium]